MSKSLLKAVGFVAAGAGGAAAAGAAYYTFLHPFNEKVEAPAKNVRHKEFDVRAKNVINTITSAEELIYFNTGFYADSLDGLVSNAASFGLNVDIAALRSEADISLVGTDDQDDFAVIVKSHSGRVFVQTSHYGKILSYTNPEDYNTKTGGVVGGITVPLF